MIPGAALALVLSASQIHWLNVAYDEGSYYGLQRYTQAIILVESSACLHKRGDDGRSFGCGQLQVATARLVCKCTVSANQLRSDSELNIRISTAYLNECFIRFWPDRGRAILCYNIGIPNATKASASQVSKSRYVKRVLSYLKALQAIPESIE